MSEISTIKQLIESEQERLYTIAMGMADQFWREHFARREQKEKSLHGLRVRRGRAGISAQWFKRRFTRKKAGGWQAHDDYIRIGDRARYSAHDFRAMAPWERAIADAIEPRLAPIRQHSKALARIAKIVSAYEKREAQRTNRFGDQSKLDLEGILETVDHLGKPSVE